MSEQSDRPLWQTVAVSLVLTAALVTVAYYAWIYANIWVRQWDLTKGSLVTDAKFFIGLRVVFVVLSILDKIIGLVKGLIWKDH